MPFKSQAQRRKFAHPLVEGKIKDDTYEEWNRSTGRKALPERIHPKKQGPAKKASPKKAKRASPNRKSPAPRATRKSTRSK